MGDRSPSLIADTFEAVVAAVYLDGGVEAADAFIERQFCDALEDIRAGRTLSGGVTDHKSSLQEWLEAHDQPLPIYVLVGRGDQTIGRSSRSRSPSAARR